MIYVIGSGPAAVAAAYALSGRKRDVCILDVGNRLEPAKLEAKQRLAATSPLHWVNSDLAAIQAGSAPTTKGLPKKLVYGSGYVYEEPQGAAPIESHDAKVMRSYAFGGLSNVWGACALPYPEAELGDWPETARKLEPHYRAVSEIMPQVGEADALDKLLPNYGGRYGIPLLSRQALALRANLERHRERLAASHIHYGAARLALRNDADDCHQCGQCLYGCPYDLIYSSAHSLPTLMERGVRYRGNTLVRKITEHAGGCRISARSGSTGKTEILEGERVFVGAGIWGTAELMLRSLGAFDTDLVMKHSDRFMLPLVRLTGTPGVRDEAMTTLCQLFLELDDRRVAQQSVHLQVYTYNDMMRTALESKLGPLSKLLSWPLDQFLSRLLILFGYVHSNSSQYLRVRLSGGKDQRLVVRGMDNPESRRIACRTVGRILREFRAFRAIPAWPMMDPPGGGNHTGGSFPMSEHPTGFQTDIFGRLPGWSRTHIVDSSTFPSLAAATVLYPSMANAHRIASSCEL